MLPAKRANELTYAAYCQLGGCLNSSLQAVQRHNGSYHYTTYHYVGVGQPFWKQDLPKGPTGLRRPNRGRNH